MACATVSGTIAEPACDTLRTLLRALVPPLTHQPAAPAPIAASITDVRANFPLALALSSLAGASTGLGGLLMVLPGVQSDLTTRRLGLWQGAAAGFMLSVSCFDLAPSVLEELPWVPALFYFAVGAAMFVLLKLCIPEPDLSAFAKTNDASLRQVLWSGLLTALGISLHNFPEGIAVGVASLKGIHFGLPLALAIGAHNIPEGMAVALPIYFATRKKSYAVKLAFLSGMAEPAGVLFLFAAIHLFGSLTKFTVAAMLSAVAGIMVILSIIELYPQARKHAGSKDALLSTVAGLCIMTVVLRVISRLGFAV